LAAQGKNQEAIDHYGQAISIKPHADVLYYNRAISYVNTGQYQLALDDYSKAIRLKSDETTYYNARGSPTLDFINLRKPLKISIQP
jgi:tetratricopeptide (TPR) repeat protein